MAISHPAIRSLLAESGRGPVVPKIHGDAPDTGEGCFLLAIIPAYNEEHAIGSVVLKTKQIASRVIVVDDGSVDDTALIAAAAGASVISHPTNRGKGAALRTGFVAALDFSPGAVVVLDADGQHDPRDIPRVAEPVLEDRADMVIGSRYMKGPGTTAARHGKGAAKKKGTAGHAWEGRTPVHRRLGQLILDRFTGAAGDRKLKLTDTQSGFRAFSGDVIQRFSFDEDGFGIESEMIAEAVEKGLRIEEVPVKSLYPGNGTSHTYKAGRHGAGVLTSLLRFIREKHPFVFFGGPGLFLLMVGLIMGIKTVNIYDQGGVLPVGYAMLSMLLTIIGSLAIVGAVILHSIKQTVWKIRLAFD